MCGCIVRGVCGCGWVGGWVGVCVLCVCVLCVHSFSSSLFQDFILTRMSFNNDMRFP